MRKTCAEVPAASQALSVARVSLPCHFSPAPSRRCRLGSGRRGWVWPASVSESRVRLACCVGSAGPLPAGPAPTPALVTAPSPAEGGTALSSPVAVLGVCRPVTFWDVCSARALRWLLRRIYLNSEQQPLKRARSSGRPAGGGARRSAPLLSGRHVRLYDLETQLRPGHGAGERGPPQDEVNLPFWAGGCPCPAIPSPGSWASCEPVSFFTPRLLCCWRLKSLSPLGRSLSLLTLSLPLRSPRCLPSSCWHLSSGTPHCCHCCCCSQAPVLTSQSAARGGGGMALPPAFSGRHSLPLPGAPC